MADFAPDYTPRWVCRYRSATLTHTLTLRGGRGESKATVENRASALFAQLSADLTNYLFEDLEALEASYIAEDTSIAFPSVIPALTAGVNLVDDASVIDKISTWRFSGRTAQGTKAGFFLFGVQVSPDTPGDTQWHNDFRFTSAEIAAIGVAVGHLNASGLYGIDGYQVVWRPSVTYKSNDYWVRQARKGAV